MRNDIDALMEEQGVDYLLVTGPAQHNPPMVYLTGGGHLTRADLIKKRGQEPVLFHSSMERDEAAHTGLATRDFDDYRITELLKQTGGDMVKAIVKRYQGMFADLGIEQGRMAVYGNFDAGAAYAIFSTLQQAVPEVTIFGQMDNSLLLQAMSTKDEDEVERIRRMGEITIAVVGDVAEFLTSHSVVNEVLVKPDGQPLTVGNVKRWINLWLTERGVENPHGTIFAIGRDAGIPHSSGTASDQLQLGETIVFDIFPCEAGGGYHYDFTRTWCLGYATDEALAIYEDVSSVYLQIMDELEAGLPCPEFQRRTCDLFEAKGHPTIQSEPGTQEGYVHSLGHGLGLNVHERPWFGRNASSEDRLEQGSVVTIEPGLYYPDRGLGVRLEDTVWVRPDGKMEVLAEYPHDLILKM
jgi:Xaa-Pro aminopeptidase